MCTGTPILGETRSLTHFACRRLDAGRSVHEDALAGRQVLAGRIVTDAAKGMSAEAASITPIRPVRRLPCAGYNPSAMSTPLPRNRSTEAIDFGIGETHDVGRQSTPNRPAIHHNWRGMSPWANSCGPCSVLCWRLLQIGWCPACSAMDQPMREYSRRCLPATGRRRRRWRWVHFALAHVKTPLLKLAKTSLARFGPVEVSRYRRRRGRPAAEGPQRRSAASSPTPNPVATSAFCYASPDACPRRKPYARF